MKNKIWFLLFYIVAAFSSSDVKSGATVQQAPVQHSSQQNGAADRTQLTEEDVLSIIEKMTPEERATFEAQKKEYIEKINAVFDPLFTLVQTQLSRIYNCMSNISAMVMNNHVPTVINRKATHQVFKELNNFINSLVHQKFMVADPTILINLIHITKKFTHHMIAQLNDNLKDIKPFDIQKVMSSIKVTEKDLEPATLMHELSMIDRLITVLERKSETVGLLWYNKAYRFVSDSRLVALDQRFNLHTYVPLTYLSFVLGYWILGSHTHEGKSSSFEKTRLVPEFVKKFLGNLPRMSQFGYYDNVSGYGGALEVSVHDVKQLAISGGIITATFAAAQQLFTKTVKPWLGEQLHILHHILRGGDSAKKAKQLSGIPEEVYFSDLVGLDHVKTTFQSIVDYLEKPESYARRGITPQKGILLIGGTRTGKSYSVTALYNEIKKRTSNNTFNFIEVNAADIEVMGGFKNLMYTARRLGPCVVFIDEIDLLNLQRIGQNPLLGEFLTSLSGALTSDDPKKQVIVIAATNNPENLDKALRAPGRLGLELQYELPSLQDRINFITLQIEKLSLQIDHFNIPTLAQQTEGYSFEALKGLINNATLFASINGRVVTQEDIMKIIDQELHKIVSIDNKVIPHQEKAIIATHFAGQALYLNSINSRVKIAKVTTKQVMKSIKERITGAHLIKDTEKKDDKKFEYGGLFTYLAQDSADIITHEEKKQECMLHLSGFIAEEIAFGSTSYSCNKDGMACALNIAKEIAFEGIEGNKLPTKIQTEYYRKALKIIDECKAELRILMNESLDNLTTLRNALLTQEILVEDQINALLQPKAA